MPAIDPDRPWIILDDFNVDITSKSKQHFKEALRLVFDAHRQAKGYKVSDAGTLTLYWIDDKEGITPFEEPLQYEAAFLFLQEWLQSPEVQARMGKNPTNPAYGEMYVWAFRMWTKTWGTDKEDPNRFYIMCHVRPFWSELSK